MPVHSTSAYHCLSIQDVIQEKQGVFLLPSTHECVTILRVSVIDRRSQGYSKPPKLFTRYPKRTSKLNNLNGNGAMEGDRDDIQNN
jgi:hypothetical protein